jgi:hypothetical protein
VVNTQKKGVIMLTRSLFALIAVGLLVSSASTATVPSIQAKQKGFDLRRLEDLHRGLSPSQAADLYLSFLREELRAPSPNRVGLGGGAITSDYVLAQIVLAGAEGKAEARRLYGVRAALRPGIERDAITITLGLLGDRRVVEELIAYASDWRNSPFLRERAIRGLEAIPDMRAVPVLAATLEDPFYVEAAVGTPRRVYVNRITARSALSRYRDAGLPLPRPLLMRLETLVITEEIPPPSS